MSLARFDRPVTHDLTQIKAIESFGNTLTLLRIGAVGGIAVLIWQAFDDVQITRAFVLYAALTLLQTLMVTLFPRVVGRAGMVALFLSCFLVGMAWAHGLAHLWVSHIAEQRILAICGLFWWMIYAVNARHNDLVMMSATFSAIIVTLVMFPLLSWWVLARGWEAVLLVATNTTGLFFFQEGLRDVRRVRIALLQAQRDAAEIARIEALGRLTGGVAHDFNNLMTVISGNLELVQEIDDEAEKAALLREAIMATRRAADVTGQLLTFSRRATLTPSLTHLEDVFAPLRDLLDRLLPAGTTVDFQTSLGLPPLMVDRSRLETVLLNLCLNAGSAMQPQGGRIAVLARIDWITGGSDAAKVLAVGPYLNITVRDNGAGMSPEVLARVYEPYFTTKANGHGAGLGLAMAKGFAEQSGGTLEIQSRPGQGTTATLRLPAVAAEAAAHNPARTPLPLDA